MAAWWPGLLWCPVPMALLVWAPDDAWAVVLRPEGRPPYAQAAGRWPQVPGQMVTVSSRWAVASPGGSRPPPGAAPGLCTWRAPLGGPPPAGAGRGGGGRWPPGAAA